MQSYERPVFLFVFSMLRIPNIVPWPSEVLNHWHVGDPPNDLILKVVKYVSNPSFFRVSNLDEKMDTVR